MRPRMEPYTSVAMQGVKYASRAGVCVGLLMRGTEVPEELCVACLFIVILEAVGDDMWG